MRTERINLTGLSDQEVAQLVERANRGEIILTATVEGTTVTYRDLEPGVCAGCGGFGTALLRDSVALWCGAESCGGVGDTWPGGRGLPGGKGLPR